MQFAVPENMDPYPLPPPLPMEDMELHWDFQIGGGEGGGANQITFYGGGMYICIFSGTTQF